MIRLIREDGVEILLNTTVIKKVEMDEERRAVITLTDGEIVKVKNPVYDVTQKAKAFLKGIKEERRAYEKKLPEAAAEKERTQKREKGERSDRGDRGYRGDRGDRRRTRNNNSD
jgi:polyribonucleotide nucleotidyltransferase